MPLFLYVAVAVVVAISVVYGSVVPFHCGLYVLAVVPVPLLDLRWFVVPHPFGLPHSHTPHRFGLRSVRCVRYVDAYAVRDFTPFTA